MAAGHSSCRPARASRALRYRSGDVLWHKENLIALAERQTSSEYAAYVDGDILFLDPEWAVKAVRTLQVLPVAQITSWLINMGPPPHEEGTRTAPSFMSVYLGDYETHRTAWFNNGSPRGDEPTWLSWGMLGLAQAGLP